MIFRRPSNHYGISPVPVTPHQRAAQVWDDRIGSARVQAKNWRLAFFGALLLSGGLASALVWQSVRGTITPWVVGVDRLRTEERSVGKEGVRRCRSRCSPYPTKKKKQKTIQ